MFLMNCVSNISIHFSNNSPRLNFDPLVQQLAKFVEPARLLELHDGLTVGRAQDVVKESVYKL